MSHKKEWWCVDLGQANPLQKERLDRLTESFFRFTPELIQGRNRIFLEMGRTKQFFTFHRFMERARVLAAREGLDASYWRFGVGDTLPGAWVQARFRSKNADGLPLDAYYDFLDPLEHFEMNRAQMERIYLFRSLGMKSLGQLFSVPKESWLVRFGEEFDRFLENFEWGHSPWTRYVPSLELSDRTRWNAEDYVIDAEGLIFRIKPMVDRLCERIYSLRRGLKKMEITLKLDRSNVPDRTIELGFAFPQTSRILLLKLLREKLSFAMQKEPLSDPVIEVELKVLELVKREHESLRFAFSEKDNEESVRDERYLELLSYLSLKLEPPAEVFQAELTEHLLPERSWKKVLLSKEAKSSGDRISHLFARRPLKLFSNPLPLFRVGPYLKRKEQLWRVCEFSQEERLEGYSWDVEETGGFDRTYYRVKVQNDSGTTQFWWIFKDELLGKLNLHGIY